jgi:hypothetical protein
MQKLTIIIFILFVSSTGHAKNKYIVPKTKTPATKQQLITALKNGYVNVFKKKPDINTLAMSLAQVNLENAHGKVIYNHNLGNVGPTYKEKAKYFILGPTKYKAHNTFTEGAIGYWKHLKKVCYKALPYFKKGNAYTASYVLRSCNYYGAPKSKYADVLGKLFPLAKKRILKK